MSEELRVPQRTCIGCRRKDNQGSFLRVAKDASHRVRLWTGSGRSAYICPTPECIAAALSKGRLDRALRCRIEEENRQALREELNAN